MLIAQPLQPRGTGRLSVIQQQDVRMREQMIQLIEFLSGIGVLFLHKDLLPDAKTAFQLRFVFNKAHLNLITHHLNFLLTGMFLL